MKRPRKRKHHPDERKKTATRPTLARGDEGPDVAYMQSLLPHEYDGDFGPVTEDEVRRFQQTRGLTIDGVCGPLTWAALEAHAPPIVPEPPPGLPAALSAERQAEIERIAANSEIRSYSWLDRGVMPAGYTMGCALAWANTYRQFKAGWPPAVEMAQANTGNSDKDVFSWERGRFEAVGMPNEVSGVETLRHLWVYILGLGARESSGKHCCGRDQSVPPGYYGDPSTTTEAGAWQTSWDAHGCSDNMDLLFDTFERRGAQGFLDAFEQGVTCGAEDWECFGEGDGRIHQEMSKDEPAYAAEYAGVCLRNLRQHYGPVGRREVEIQTAADAMLREVQDYVDLSEPVA